MLKFKGEKTTDRIEVPKEIQTPIQGKSLTKRFDRGRVFAFSPVVRLTFSWVRSRSSSQRFRWYLRVLRPEFKGLQPGVPNKKRRVIPRGMQLLFATAVPNRRVRSPPSPAAFLDLLTEPYITCNHNRDRSLTHTIRLLPIRVPGPRREAHTYVYTHIRSLVKVIWPRQIH